METQHVDRKTIRVWQWQAILFAVVLAIPVTGAALGAADTIWMLLPILYLVVALFASWTLPRAHYEALEYGIDEHGIAIHRGIWWRSHIALPRIRVQHSDVSQGPLQRKFGVATLKLYTAGSRYTKIELSGLAHDDALELRDALVAHGGDSGV